MTNLDIGIYLGQLGIRSIRSIIAIWKSSTVFRYAYLNSYSTTLALFII